MTGDPHPVGQSPVGQSLVEPPPIGPPPVGPPPVESPPIGPRPARRWRRVGRRIFAGLLSCCAVTGLARLALPATADPGSQPPGVRRQLTFLREALDHGAGEQAQQLFPEGYFFSHVLYGLAWVELGMRQPEGSRGAAVREATWALRRLDTPVARAPFSPDLVPAYGVFYRGWSNWLRGGVLGLQPPERRDPEQLRRLVDDSAALGAAFDASASPYLAAYPGQAWPCDATVAVASLRLHDTLLPPRFAGTVARWLGAVTQLLDPATGLLPHRVDPVTGEPVEGARGSSQSIVNRFLVEIDPALARSQYLRFRERFLSRPLRLGVAVLEYPAGTHGPADVDSGPLPLGISLSASVVAIGAAQVNGDAGVAAALATTAELAGLPVDTPWTRRYAGGLLPIGDAFLAWAKTARPWTVPGRSPPGGDPTGWWWLPPAALLVMLCAVGWLPDLLGRGAGCRRRRPGARRRGGPVTGMAGAPCS